MGRYDEYPDVDDDVLLLSRSLFLSGRNRLVFWSGLRPRGCAGAPGR